MYMWMFGEGEGRVCKKKNTQGEKFELGQNSLQLHYLKEKNYVLWALNISSVTSDKDRFTQQLFLSFGQKIFGIIKLILAEVSFMIMC